MMESRTMKKIAFCLQTMVLGGVEKELITVLKYIHSDYDITLLLLYAGDMEVLKEVPPSVKIKVMGIDKDFYCSSTVELVKQRIKRGYCVEAATIAAKRFCRIGMSHSNTNLSALPILNEEFDVAICYHIHSPLMLKYVAEKVYAHKKIGWIHNDFYGCGYPIYRLRKYITLYHEFVAVSKKVENEFRELCPWYCGEISTAYNYVDDTELIRCSTYPISDSRFVNETRVKLLTIGRFSEQKGIDLAIMAAKMLKNENYQFHWFLIGYGEQENTYRKLIAEYDVDDCFTILGKKENPYPYITNCDIYVQPSRHEAYGLVIKEAMILNKPIVCTDFDGADEQIDHGQNGLIVPLNDTAALCKAISELILKPEVRASFSKQLEQWSQGDVLQEIIKHLE